MYDYQRWSALLNDSNWSFKSVVPYFIKSEKFTKTNNLVPIDRSYHGFHGPLEVSESYPPLNNTPLFFKAFEELGYGITDYNGKREIGTSYPQTYIKNGTRFDSAMGYIYPFVKRPNLIVLDNSYVTKIEIDKTTNRAVGVVFTRNNKTYIARTRKEIIVSAGSISSPQLLLLSGIGPKEHLESVGIPVVKDLPVGKSLRDHAFLVLPFSSNIPEDSTDVVETVRQYLRGVGTLTKSATYDSINFVRTPTEPIKDYSNLEYVFVNISNNVIAQKLFRWTNETFGGLNPKVSNPFTLQIALLHTVSNGTIKLNSSDPFEYPLIDPNLISDEGNKDIEALYEGVQLAIKLTETQVFRNWNVSLAFNNFPGCEDTKFLSKEFWYCYMRKITTVGLHPVGTCLTGTSSENGVVDSKLNVFGIQGLRVIDASVIPFPPSGHTNAVVTMVAEKASDIIKQFYNVL